MKPFQLTFSTINILQNSIVEIIANEGIEITVDMIKELHSFLDNKVTLPCKLLINKTNSYTYSFEAMQYFGFYKNISASAIVVYNRTSETVVNYAHDFTRNQDWNMSIFKNRESAIDWLKQQPNY